MSVIPLKAYRLVERRLRDRWELAARAKAEENYQEATTTGMALPTIMARAWEGNKAWKTGLSHSLWKESRCTTREAGGCLDGSGVTRRN